MTTIFTCYRAGYNGRSVELSQAYQKKGYDVAYFEGGAQRMAGLETEQLSAEISRRDTVVFIVDDWGSLDPQRKIYAKAEGLVSLLGIRHYRKSSLDLMQQLHKLPNISEK